MATLDPPAASRTRNPLSVYRSGIGLLLVALVVTEGVGAWLHAEFITAGGALLMLAILPWLLVQGSKMGRLFVAASVLGAIAVVLTQDAPLPILASALQRAAFFQAFLIAVFTLQEAAGRSESMAKVGRFLVTQPIRKQALLTLCGTNLMALMMNMGSLVFIGILARDTDADDTTGPKSERAWITALAAIRGFSPSACWSPLALPPVYLSSLVAAVSLKTTMLVGAVLSAAILLFSVLFTALEVRKTTLDQPDPAPFPKRSILRISLLLAGLFSLIFFISGQMAVSTSAAVMIIIPAASILWLIALQGYRLRGLVSGPLKGMVLSRLPDQAAATSVITSAAFLGPIIVSLLPVPAITTLLAASSASPSVILSGVLVTIIALSMVGLNPVLTCAIAAGIISQPLNLGIEPIALVAVLLVGWALSAQFSPYTGTATIVSSIFGVSPVTLIFTRNRAFMLSCMALCVATIFVTQKVF